jgi:site-specific recombinase XerD
MIEDTTVRGFSADTQRGYIRAVRDFAAFLDRSPDRATAEDLRRFQIHMRSEGASAPSMNATVSAHWWPQCGRNRRDRPRWA